MSDIDALTKQVARHLAGREVVLRWRSPASSSAMGQVYKSADGRVFIDISPIEFLNTRYKIYLHELAHVHLDYGWLPVSKDYKLPSRSIVRTQSQRDEWRSNSHELSAHQLADEWYRYAEQHAHEHWRAGRSSMECKLLALLTWSK